ncbi:hypothetical protein AAG906_035484 [Vitis piasezkii]
MTEKQPTLDVTKALTDASSPYFLHFSDQPNHSLNKLGFVTDSLSKPKDDTVAAL